MKGKTYIVGDSVTLADIALCTAFIPSFQTVLDAAFRKTVPDFSNWFAKCTGNQKFIDVVGIIKPIEKAMGAFDPNAKVAAVSATSAKKDDDGDLDLFGDDDDEDAAAAAKAAAEAAKAKKKKEKPPEMSLIIFEVKPLDDTTDLDALA